MITKRRMAKLYSRASVFIDKYLGWLSLLLTVGLFFPQTHVLARHGVFVFAGLVGLFIVFTLYLIAKARES